MFGKVSQEDPERVLARRPPLDDPRISTPPELEARTPLSPPSSGRSDDRQGAADAADDDKPRWQPGAQDPLALFGAGGAAASVSSAPPAASTPLGVDPLVGELLRSLAWGGDRRRGTARIELGAGRYGGTTLQVDVVGEGLCIDLEAPPGVDAAALGERLAERFAARGLRVESLTVR